MLYCVVCESMRTVIEIEITATPLHEGLRGTSPFGSFAAALFIPRLRLVQSRLILHSTPHTLNSINSLSLTPAPINSLTRLTYCCFSNNPSSSCVALSRGPSLSSTLSSSSPSLRCIALKLASGASWTSSAPPHTRRTPIPEHAKAPLNSARLRRTTYGRNADGRTLRSLQASVSLSVCVFACLSLLLQVC